MKVYNFKNLPEEQKELAQKPFDQVTYILSSDKELYQVVPTPTDLILLSMVKLDNMAHVLNVFEVYREVQMGNIALSFDETLTEDISFVAYPLFGTKLR